MPRTSTKTSNARNSARDRTGRPRLVRDLWVAALVAAVGAAVAAAVAAVPSLFDDPDPRGDVAIVRTLRHQTLDMFEGKASAPADNHDFGVVIEVRRTGEHVPADGCHLSWTWLDADGPAPVADARLVSQEAAHVRPDGKSCSTHARVWVPLSAGLEGYRHVAVRLDLYAADQLLDSDVTETIPLG